MNESELVSNWSSQKVAKEYLRLVEPCSVAHEFSGRIGHPSQFARVGFKAVPADSIKLDFEVKWPEEFDDAYSLRIRQCIAEAVLDGLWGVPQYPHRGCELKLVEFGWHEYSGSEMSVRHATALAMAKLRSEGKWTMVPAHCQSGPP